MPGKLKNGQEFKRVDERVIGLEILEAEFLDDEPDGAKRVILKILQGRASGHSGISFNKNFYSGEAAESLVPLLEQRRKMYLNHAQVSKFGRDMNEWTATVEQAWGKDGAAFVKVKMTANPRTEWLFEEMKQHPEEVGVSIHAMVRGVKGIIDKISVFIVEAFTFLMSADFVGDASAGGGVESVIESQFNDPQPDETSQLMTILEGALADRLDKNARRSKFYSIGYAVTDLMRSIAVEKDTEDSEKAKKIKEIADEFLTELDKIRILDLFDSGDYPYYESIGQAIDLASNTLFVAEELAGMFAVITEDEELIELGDEFFEIISSAHFPELNKKKKKKKQKGDEEDKDKKEELSFSSKKWSEVNRSKLPVSAFFFVGETENQETWHLPYKDEEGKINEGIWRATLSLFEGARGNPIFSIPKSVQNRILELINRIETEWVEENPTKEDFIVTAEEIKGLTLEQILGAGNQAVLTLNVDKETAETTVKTLEVQVSEAKEENDKMTAELDKKALAENERARGELISTLLGESKIIDQKNDHHVSEVFMTQLQEASDEDAVKELVKDREATIKESREKSTGRIKNAGGNPGDHGSPDQIVNEGAHYELPEFPGSYQERRSTSESTSGTGGKLNDDELAASLRS